MPGIGRDPAGREDGNQGRGIQLSDLSARRRAGGAAPAIPVAPCELGLSLRLLLAHVMRSRAGPALLILDSRL